MKCTVVTFDNSSQCFVSENKELYCLTGQLYNDSPPVAIPVLVPTDEERYYLFPGRYYEFKRAVLFTRLRSTRSGSGACWTANEEARALLNDAPYEPWLSGWGLTLFRWTPPLFWEREGEEQHPLNEFERPYVERDCPFVLQQGSEENNWYAQFHGDYEPWIQAPEPPEWWVRPSDHNRLLKAAFRAAVISKNGLPTFGEKIVQGHLEIHPVERPKFSNVFYRQLFFNHFCPSWDIMLPFFQRNTWGGKAYALAKVWKNTVVISPDHEPVELEKGWYLLNHPIPTDNVD